MWRRSPERACGGALPSVPRLLHDSVCSRGARSIEGADEIRRLPRGLGMAAPSLHGIVHRVSPEGEGMAGDGTPRLSGHVLVRVAVLRLLLPAGGYQDDSYAQQVLRRRRRAAALPWSLHA